MKLLRDVELFCIKVDYFMWSEEKGDYTEPAYLSIDTETKKKDGTCANIIIFEEKITPHLRVFDKAGDAVTYIVSHINNHCYCENPRVVKIKYNAETNEWEES
jgi:hypothetical protein